MEFILFGLWTLRTIASLLSSTYSWQLKEYRWDRMREFLMQQRTSSFYTPYQVVLVIFMGGVLLLELFTSENPLKNWIVPVVGTLFLAEVLAALHNVWNKQLKRPRPTFKALLIMTLTFGVELMAVGVFFVLSGGSLDLIDLTITLGILAAVEHDLQAICVMGIANPLSSAMKKRSFVRASEKRAAMKSLKVIGITGSFGKTTVKEILTHILEGSYRVLKTKANTNTEIGIAQTILKDLKSDHQVFVCEMGAYNIGEIKICCRIARPQIGIFTGLNEQHLALFGSVDRTFQAKWELISSLPETGVGVFNGDCEALRSRLKPFRGKSIVCGTGEADKMIRDLHVYTDRVQFTYQDVFFEAPLMGRFQIINVLMAIKAAEEIGMEVEAIAKRVKTLEAPSKTMELKAIEKGFIIDDSYNVNPDGLRAAVEHLETFEGYKKILFFPGILELGSNSEKMHEELGSFIGARIDYAFFTDANFEPALSRGALQGGLTRSHIFGPDDQAVLLEQVHELFKKHPKDKWVILFESRGAEKVMGGLL